MHGKIKLKLENYRDGKCVTQTAWIMNKTVKVKAYK